MNTSKSTDSLINDNLNLDISDKSEILFEDDHMIITDKEIILKNYYFPLFTSKTIKLNEIKSFKLYQPRSFFTMKSWGMAIDFEVWWHLDMKRKYNDRFAIVLNTNQWPKIGITPRSGKAESVIHVSKILKKYIKQEESSFMI